MKSKRVLLWALGTALGIAIGLGGLIAHKITGESQFSFLAAGLGLALLGTAGGKLVTALLTTPEAQKKQDVDLKDERNAAIREKAAWHSIKVTLPAMSVAGLALALRGDLFGATLMAGVIAVYSISILWYSVHFSKTM